MKKRGLAVLLAASMGASLAACGSSGVGSGPAAATSGNSGTDSVGKASTEAESNAGETSGVASDETSKQKKPERINRSDLLAARRVEEARKARAERIERQRYEEPIGDAPEPAEESIDDFEDSGERKPKKQSNKKGTRKQGKKNVELPGDDFEDLG